MHAYTTLPRLKNDLLLHLSTRQGKLGCAIVSECRQISAKAIPVIAREVQLNPIPKLRMSRHDTPCAAHFAII
jgi:hypothetical protein